MRWAPRDAHGVVPGTTNAETGGASIRFLKEIFGLGTTNNYRELLLLHEVLLILTKKSKHLVQIVFEDYEIMPFSIVSTVSVNL